MLSVLFSEAVTTIPVHAGDRVTCCDLEMTLMSSLKVTLVYSVLVGMVY